MWSLLAVLSAQQDDITVEQALDLPAGMVVEHEGTAQGQSFVTHDGEDAAALLEVDTNQLKLALPVEGSALVRFWGRSGYQSAIEMSGWNLAVGNVPLVNGFDLAWKQYERVVPQGELLEWSVRPLNRQGFTDGTPVTWIDEVEVVGPVALGDVVTPGLVVSSSGEHPWLAMPTELTPGSGGAFRTPMLGETETSWLEGLAQGPGTLSFRYQTTDWNQVIQLVINGEVLELPFLNDPIDDWAHLVLPLPQDAHSVRWTVTGDGASDPEVDAAFWLADIKFESTPLLNDVLDMEVGEISWTPGEDTWDEDASVKQVGVSSLKGTGAGLVSVVLEGPGAFGFWWRSSEEAYPLVVTSVSGSSEFVVKGEDVWQHDVVRFGEGTHSLTLSVPEADRGDTLWLDGFALTPFVNPADALSWTSELVLGPTSDAWRGVSSPEAGGGSYLVPTPGATLSTSITGPGTFRYSYVDGPTPIVLSVDGVVVPFTRWPPTTLMWHSVDVELSEGEHVLSWEAASDVSAFGAEVVLDAFRFEPGVREMATALDEDDVIWVRRDLSWQAQSETTVDGEDALGVHEGGYLFAVLPSPGILTYSAKSLGDLVPEFNLDLNGAWQEQLLLANEEGAQAVTWLASSIDQMPEAYLDAFDYYPSHAVSVSEALDLDADWTVSADSDVLPIGTSYAQDGDDLVVLGSGSVNDYWLDASIEGPGTLDFSWRRYGDGVTGYVLAGDYYDHPGSRWSTVSLTLKEGVNELRWGGNLLLDEVVFTPEAAPRLNAALGLSHDVSVYSTGIPEPWKSGVGENEMTALVGEAGSEVSVYLTGPGLCRFRWRSDSLNPNDHLAFGGGLFGASSGNRISAPLDWRTDRVLLPDSRIEILRALPAGIPATSWWQDFEILEEVESVPVGEVFGDSLMFETSATKPWRGRVFENPVSGERVSFVSPDSTASFSESSWLQTTVSGPGTLEVDYGSGTAAPNSRTSRFYPAGNHVVRWEFRYNSRNLAQVDAVRWMPGDSLLGSALGLDASKSVYTGGTELWRVDGLDTIRSGDVDRAGVSSFVPSFAGPGLLRFDYRVEGPVGNGLLVSRWPFEGLLNSASWATAEVHLAEVELGISFAYHENIPSAGGAWLKNLRVVPYPNVSEALDMSPLELASAGTKRWFPFRTPSAMDGEEVIALNCADVAPEEAVWLDGGEVEGPGVLRFSTKFQDGTQSQVILEVNGQHAWSRAGFDSPDAGPWKETEVLLDDGPNVIRWAYVGVPTRYLGQVWLDGISFESSALPDEWVVLAGANPQAIALSGWALSPEEHAPNGGAVFEASIEGEGVSRLHFQLDLLEGGVLTYWRKRTSGYLTAESINGSEEYRDFEMGWSRYSVYFEPGASSVSWAYSFDELSSYPRMSSGAAWVGGFEWLPNSLGTIVLGEALDIPELSWRWAPDSTVRGFESPDAFDGIDEARIENWLETTVAGSGELSFVWGGGFFWIGEYSFWSNRVGRVRVSVPAGEQEIRWERDPRISASGMRLDQVAYVPESSEMLAALDHENLETVILAEASLDYLWEVRASPSYDGRDALVLQGPPSYEVPADLVVYGRGPTTSSYQVTRAVDASFNSEFEWRGETEEISSAGLFAYKVPVTLSVDGVWAIDRLQVAGSSEISLPEGFDSALNFTTGSQNPWTVKQTAASFDGIDLIETDGRAFGEESWVETSVMGPADVSFWWQGRGRWSVNDIVLAVRSIAVEADIQTWAPISLQLPAGEHRLRWAADRSIRLALDRLEVRPSNGHPEFALWAAMQGLEEGAALPLAVPLDDEISNLVKYAFGFDLSGSVFSQTGTFLPRQEIRSGALGDRLQIEFLRRIGSPLIYQPQFTGDLESWSPIYDFEEVRDLGNGWQRVVVTDDVGVSETGMRAGRVEVTLP